MNYLSGNTIRVPGVGLTRDGIPKCLGPLIPYIRDKDSPYHFIVLRLTFTLLSMGRAVKDIPNPDLDAITHPYKGVEGFSLPPLEKEFWKTFGYKASDSVPRRLAWKKFHFTTKSGPNGHALWSWLTDVSLLPDSLRESIKTLGGVKMTSYLDALDKRVITWLAGFFNLKETGKIRKLSYFADKEGKTRVIAILDYFSQSVLKPLHLYLFSFLRKIDQDVTFDQNAFKDKIKDWEVFYSVDLKSATDRFPIKVISQVLRGRLPASYVSAWEDIMIGYPFILENREFKYSVGNPMGAYSSWASFAVAHHFIFFCIAKDLKVPYKTLKYVLLGDDVLIGSADIASKYMEIMKNLGVEISLAKTHISPHFCEFAKQLIYRGKNISPFPISALKNSGKSWDLLTALLVAETRKDWDITSIPKAVSDYFGIMFSRPSRNRKSIELNAKVLYNLINIIRGVLPAGEALTDLCREWGISLPPIRDDIGINIIANIMVELFSNSQPEVGKGKPLGLLAENFLIYLTTPTEVLDEAILMKFHQNPLTDGYGSIEQSYLDLRKLAREIDTVKSGQWPLLLRSMTIPLSDRLFIDRFEDTQTRAISSLAKPLKERFLLLQQYPQLLEF